MTRVAPVTAIIDWTVTPVANPGRAIRFQPLHRWRRLVWVTTPRAVTTSEAVPFIQNPRPATNEKVVGSVGRAEDHPNPPVQASYAHASAHARPAAKSPNLESVKTRGIPSKFSPVPKERRNFTAIEDEKVVCPA